jgi:hypothetical protein
VEPQIQCRRDDDATAFEVEHVRATAWDAGALEDDVAVSKSLEASLRGYEHIGSDVGGVVN